MAAGTQTHSRQLSDRGSDHGPEVSVCETCPGRSVFIEAENTDGWIATDLTVDIIR